MPYPTKATGPENAPALENPSGVHSSFARPPMAFFVPSATPIFTGNFCW